MGILYNADGGDIDWMYAKYQIMSYVLELNSRREVFNKLQWRQKTVERNRVGCSTFRRVIKLV